MRSEQQRLLAVLTGTVGTVAAIALIHWARPVLIPIAVAVLLSFVMGPIVTRLHRRGLNRILSVALTVSFVMVLTLGIGALLSRQVVQLVDTLPDRREAIKEKLVEAKRFFVGDGESRLGQLANEVLEVFTPPKQADVLLVKNAEPSFGHQLETYVSPAAEMLGQAAFTAILTVFMLLRREDLRNRAIRLMGDGHIMSTTKAVDDASRRISRYLLTQLVLNLAFGLVITIGLMVLGLEYAFLWGAIATLMRYVPYIGTWLGMILPLTFSITTAPAWGGGWGQPIGVFTLYMVLELICGNFLEPRVFGKSMGISEVAQIVAAAVWAFLWGPIGLILSGPLTVCLLVLGRHVARYRFLVVLLGDEPPLSPKMAFYQRLAARDQDEASEVAHAAAKEMGLDECYDRVLLPALCKGRQDVASGELDAADLRFMVEATEEVAIELAEAHEPSEDREDAVRILLSPARDRAERVAAEIFATTLDPARWDVQIAGDEMVASELVARVEEFRPAVVVIAALPPGGVSHTNYLVTRLKRSFPELKIFVGRWGSVDEDEDSLAASKSRGIESMTRSLSGTRKELDDLHAILNAKKNGPRRVLAGAAS